MKFLLIYGPPAAGKLTVANEIAKRKNYKVFSNHTLVGSVASIFSFNEPSLKTKRNELSRKFRLEIFKEAAIQNLNVVSTYGGSGKDKFEFFKDIQAELKKLGAEVYFVHLKPSKEAILDRVESSSRKGVKIDTKEFLQKKLSTEAASYYEKFPEVEHLDIDNSDLEPEKVADIIIKNYHL